MYVVCVEYNILNSIWKFCITDIGNLTFHIPSTNFYFSIIIIINNIIIIIIITLIIIITINLFIALLERSPNADLSELSWDSSPRLVVSCSLVAGAKMEGRSSASSPLFSFVASSLIAFDKKGNVLPISDCNGKTLYPF